MTKVNVLSSFARKKTPWIDAQQYNLEYGYNLAGQLITEKYPSGKIVTTSYDANGRLSGVADPSRTYLSGMQYLGKGNSVSQMTLGNGTVENYTLNDRFQMTGQELKRGTEVLQKYNYGYGEIDGSGNLVTTKNNGQLGRIESYIGTAKQSTQKFLYDHIGRLKESAEYRGDNNSLTYKQKFDFDRFGNLYRKAASNPTAGQANPLAYTPIEETTTPGTGDIEKSTNRFRTGTTYDDAGQVVADNKFRSMNFAYDANGRQVNSTNSTNSTNAQTVYDASGNRVATKINNIWQYMIYDAFGKLVAEYGVASEGVGGVKYLQQDWQGSVRTVTNNNGFVVGRTDHQAFGNDVGYGVGQRSVEQGYSGGKATRQGYGLTERDDATGQDHTWFRKNENLAGRWTSPDPYNGSMSLGDPQSFNRYSYVQSDPTNFVDPSGLQMAICYIDGFQANCSTAFHLVQSGGGYVSWHSVDWLTVVNEYTLIDDRWTRTGQYLHFNPLYNFNPEGNLGPRGGGGGNKNNSEDDFSDCRDEVRAEFMSDIFAASDKFNKANSDHILDPASLKTAALGIVGLAGGILFRSPSSLLSGLAALSWVQGASYVNLYTLAKDVWKAYRKERKQMARCTPILINKSRSVSV